jgi:hypothetical protein
MAAKKKDSNEVKVRLLEALETKGAEYHLYSANRSYFLRAAVARFMDSGRHPKKTREMGAELNCKCGPVHSFSMSIEERRRIKRYLKLTKSNVGALFNTALGFELGVLHDAKL